MRVSGRFVLGLVLVSLAGVSWGDLTRDEGYCVFVDLAEHVSCFELKRFSRRY